MVSQVIVTVTTLCDICLHSEPSLRVESTHTDVIKFNKRHAKQLDTCDDHYRARVEPLLTYVTDYGAVPEAERKARGKADATEETQVPRPRRPRRDLREDIPCPVPGCDLVVRGNSGLSAHLRGKTHNDKERAALARRQKSA